MRKIFTKMYLSPKRTPLFFKRFSRKGYAVFNSIGKVVHIGVLKKSVSQSSLEKQGLLTKLLKNLRPPHSFLSFPPDTVFQDAPERWDILSLLTISLPLAQEEEAELYLIHSPQRALYSPSVEYRARFFLKHHEF